MDGLRRSTLMTGQTFGITSYRLEDQQRSYQTEYRVKTPGGQFRWVLDSASPITTSGGTLQGFIGSIVDNQLRKTAELARDRSEHRLQIALRASSIGIWQWDVDCH
ncbi:PAS domain-containing protein [Devosia riboflavina]